ncbi:hypothetical protein P243_1239 [Klebsiella pneumoniae subsp. pneumoniae 1158]|nr:hypothetical protein P243_1239 [Klebsiella pneumoniae subsp. pneumoniae 1158]
MIQWLKIDRCLISWQISINFCAIFMIFITHHPSPFPRPVKSE